MKVFFHFSRAVVCFTVFFYAQPGISQSLLDQKKQELENLKEEKQELEKEVENLKLKNIIVSLQDIGYPAGEKSLKILEHQALVVGYDESHKLAQWVFHKLIPDVNFGNVTRSNDFRPDPLLGDQSAVQEDYFVTYDRPDGSKQYDGFGFDRGHLAPSADFRWSATALSESYFYSNMTPQRPGFNRDSWAAVEDVLRGIVYNEPKEYFVVTGPVLKTGLPVIERGKNKLSIPEYHYKIIVDTSEDKPRGMAFLMPNEECDYPIDYYVVPIDSIEALTGLNFFPGLNPQLEEKIESQSNFSDWKTGKPKGDVAPMRKEKLPEGVINTVEAGYHAGEEKTVLGKVVSVKYIPSSQTTFLNLDRGFPGQIFTISIWKRGRRNFSYKPEEYLDGKYILVTGTIEPDRKQVPTINVLNEKQIQLWDDYRGGVR
mgnify:CR=1 FL=1